MSSHQWGFTASSPTCHVETCLKCGLVRITTLSGAYFFTQLNPQHAQCPSPYRESIPARGSNE